MGISKYLVVPFLIGVIACHSTPLEEESGNSRLKSGENPDFCDLGDEGEHDLMIPMFDRAIAASFTQPAGGLARTCVILVGGTMSHDRDGRFLTKKNPGRDAIKQASDELVASGFATLRYDRPGFGKSPSWFKRLTYGARAEILVHLIAFARQIPALSNVITAGESAGGYVIGLAAISGAEMEGTLFLGALASPSREMYYHNFGRLKEWAEFSKANMSWARTNAYTSLRMGYVYEDMFAAATRGDDVFTFTYNRKHEVWDLARRKEELANPPMQAMQNIPWPVMALQGERDMNVPQNDALIIRDTLASRGNADVSAFIVPEADHNFQIAPDDFSLRLMQRFEFTSFSNDYSEEFYQAMIDWASPILS